MGRAVGGRPRGRSAPPRAPWPSCAVQAGESLSGASGRIGGVPPTKAGEGPAGGQRNPWAGGPVQERGCRSQEVTRHRGFLAGGCPSKLAQFSQDKLVDTGNKSFRWLGLDSGRTSAVRLTAVFGCLPETDGAVFRILTEAEGPTEDAAVPLELVFHLPAGYPSCAPGVSVNSERLTRAQRAALREQLLERARSLPPQPMVHELVLWARQHLGRVLAQTGPGAGPRPSAASAAGDEGLWMALLRLDHMRARTRYVKAVRQWASDAGLTGRLMFAGRAILLLLQGRRGAVKVQLAHCRLCLRRLQCL